MSIARTTRGSLLTVLAVTLPAGSPAQEVAAFDSAGVHLGDDMQQARTALKERGFVVSEIIGKYPVAADTPFVQTLTAEKEDKATRENVVVRLDEPPSESRAFLVWRSISFKGGKAPTLESYRAAVREKAGNETYWHDERGRIVEQYVQ